MKATFAIGSVLLLVLVLAGFIVGITWWIIGGRSKGSDEMSCGGCGYPVRGLEALNCPECGADLRKVGINRPRGGNAGVGMVLTILCALLLLGFLGSALFMANGGSNSSSPVQAVPLSPAQPSGTSTTPAPPVGPDVAAPEDGQAPDSTSDEAPAEDESP